MDLTYGVADLHGSDDLLDLALAQIGKHAARVAAGQRTVVFLGDYVDRGPGSRAILDRLMAGPPEGWRWLCLMGNHERMMVDACDGRADLAWWLDNGGDATLTSFGLDPRRATSIPSKPLAWVRALPSLVADRHRVYVHAGVDATMPLDAQDAHQLLWCRARNNHGHQGRFVVHGHTPHPHGPVTDGLSLNLDTFAWSTGRLVVAVFDDERAGGPIQTIEALRPA